MPFHTDDNKALIEWPFSKEFHSIEEDHPKLTYESRMKLIGMDARFWFDIETD